MPVYLVSLEKGLSEEEYAAAYQHAKDQGGEIVTEYDRTGPAPGYAAEFPDDVFTTLTTAPNVKSVEGNGKVYTQ